jgi:hypothetical protein
MRGKVARTQINKIEMNNVSTTNIEFLKNVMFRLPIIIVALIILIAKMLVYSAIKINANTPLLYSTLNPDTNSDSPSAKSNGVRLVSAKFVINHIMVINGITTIMDEC